ncbi:hypothetical protein [Paenibacillus sp. MSJ-34]|uniref:hypothetical protein n=1 Tax=Paenibacillus sp. MSJ-34 TaxID=2841529 RepID=UPI001C0FA632|nr:hypothetical protein [Paenibacillus sp. MSJ-34]MBU5444885.1 hypothetical protein [Paenibacillus sp. MSJ-34]
MKTIVQSVIFSLLLIVVYYGVQIGIGYYMTLHYVPDIVDSYAQVGYLQHQVSFGVIRGNPDLEFAALFVGGCAAFILLKTLWLRTKRK